MSVRKRPTNYILPVSLFFHCPGNSSSSRFTGCDSDCRARKNPYIPLKLLSMLSEDKFLTLAKEKYTEINALTEHPNMLDYERGLREVMDDLARSVINEQYGRANR
jgi:hypothetical protein